MSKWSDGCYSLLTVLFIAFPVVLAPKAVYSAEKVTFNYAPFGEFDISVDALELFAKEGKTTEDLALYDQFLTPQQLEQLRHLLRQRINIDPVTISKLLNRRISQDFLYQIGTIIQTHPESNGLYPLRAAIINATASPDGLTIINLIRHFPTEELYLNTEVIFDLLKQFQTEVTSLQQITDIMTNQAQVELLEQSKPDFSKLADLRQPGSYSVISQSLNVTIDDWRDTPQGLIKPYNLEFDAYLPQNLREKAPIVVISHGLAAEPSFIGYLGQHLASYGFAVLIPRHPGSDSRYMTAILNGKLRKEVAPLEFVNRSWDIKHLLDKVTELGTQRDSWANQVNPNQVGVIGISFGGYTSLTLAGAPLNFERLEQECPPKQANLNLSLLLQCQARFLPPDSYNLADNRVKAAIAISPTISTVLGVESLRQISIPTLLFASSEDILAPAIAEQIYPFTQLQTPDKYLALLVNTSHFAAEGIASDIPYVKMPPSLIKAGEQSRESYFKSLTVAFMETHLRNNSDYQPYLSSGYAQYLNQDQANLVFIHHLSLEQLESAVNIPIIP